MAGDGRGLRGKGLVALGVVAGVLVGLLLAVGLLGRGGGTTAQAAGEIYLAPASATGPNPFTASLMTPGGTSLPPTPTAAPPPLTAQGEGGPRRPRSPPRRAAPAAWRVPPRRRR